MNEQINHNPVRVLGDIRIYTTKELSSFLGIGERKIREYLREGIFKGKKIGRAWFITEESVKEFFESDLTEQEKEELSRSKTTKKKTKK